MIQEEQTRECVVIVPVHNALSQTTRCLESICATRSVRAGIIVVNDASDEVTTQYLREFTQRTPDCVLLENETNLGFLRSANRALHLGAESAPIVILLNSDTIATPGWLESFLRTFASDARIALATPFSNNAVNLTLPMLPGENYRMLAESLRLFGESVADQTQINPDITTAIGFCLGIRSKVLAELGVFDEAFSPGYGEDTDYHFRCTSAGYRSVLVGDCFIYHEHHASFGERAGELARSHYDLFHSRWGDALRRDRERDEIAAPIPSLIKRFRSTSRPAHAHEVLFILPSTALAGGHIVVFEIVNRLILRGVDASVIILTEEEPIGMELLFQPYFLPHRAWRGAIPESSTYVATRFDTVPYTLMASRRYRGSNATILVQGYEPEFPGADRECVLSGYRACAHRIVVSRWLEQRLEHDGFTAKRIPNGVDTRFFTPGGTARSSHVSVLTLFRDDPKGGSQRAARVLGRLRVLRPDIEILGVGELVSKKPFQDLCTVAIEKASRVKMRELYQQADIFFDGSDVQGFGLMGLEAMASGAATLLTKTGGVVEYANDENSLLVPVGDEETMLRELLRLVDSPELRKQLAEAGRRTAHERDWDRIVFEYDRYFRALSEETVSSSSEVLEREQNQWRALELYYLREKQGDVTRNSASFIFSREFEDPHGPRGISDVFRKWQRSDLESALREHHQGQLLLEMYEQGTRAIRRASEAHRTSDLTELDPSNLFSQVVYSLGLGKLDNI